MAGRAGCGVDTALMDFWSRAGRYVVVGDYVYSVGY